MIKKTFIGHLNDVKLVLIRIFLIFFILFFINLYFADQTFAFLIKIIHTGNIKFVFSGISGGVSSKISIAFNLTMVLLFPLIAFEVLLYTKGVFYKGLYGLWLFLFALMFYFISVLSAVIILIPIFAKFLLSVGFFGIDFYIDANVFISFLMQIIFAFAFIFQLPIILTLLIKAEVININSLKKQRKKVFVCSFILGAVLTPPDVLSQVVAAILMYAFYEGTIFFSYFSRKKT
jgi:sec-independent protein translocase protein TatC